MKNSFKELLEQRGHADSFTMEQLESVAQEYAKQYSCKKWHLLIGNETEYRERYNAIQTGNQNLNEHQRKFVEDYARLQTQEDCCGGKNVVPIVSVTDLRNEDGTAFKPRGIKIINRTPQAMPSFVPPDVERGLHIDESFTQNKTLLWIAGAIGFLMLGGLGTMAIINFLTK